MLQLLNQKKASENNNQSHFGGVSFIEPITKKIKIEASYDFMYYDSKQDKKAFNNIGGEYNELDSSLTNNFINVKQINRAGLKFIYEVKKMRFTIGTKARNVFVNNNNIFTDQNITQKFNNILPFSTIRYKFSDNKMLDVKYTTSSQNPTISQLQPVFDNSNPNFINIGNPSLLPTFMHSVNLNFNSWKAISGKYTWMGLTYNYINNDIATATSYDSIGRTVAQAINVNGNYNLSGFIGTNIPMFSKKLTLAPSGNASYSSNKILINGDCIVINFKDNSVATIDISKLKAKDKLINKILLNYGEKAEFKSIVIKDETIRVVLYLNKEAVIKLVSFNDYKTELNAIIKAAFKKLDKYNDTK